MNELNTFQGSNQPYRQAYLDKIKELYLTGIPVTRIAEIMDRSRWAVYLALNECGVDTSLGFKGRLVPTNKIQDFLNNEWMQSSLSREPSKIAKHLGVPSKSVHSVLRNRRQALKNRADKIPMEDVMSGFIFYIIDPYRMIVEFHGIGEDGKSKTIEMTPSEMEEAIRRIAVG